ncbi:hypothetical protein HC026_09360 [Lactobacillus sp. LC28-10]|uniref:Surface layer protein A domain-containing protein n=1 Tax=Secundilactobacillus angelensis TaxID=2722706 RepID=A0ABX1L219_9LACO|nr:hypothetical protein [Secundilactobacillus angelensis]MCH5462626.1 hypothetical protein [Secundilactobacillus angelensis]NLR19118.1 hypothetical protein [Secundilactobacillus angelensis]
MKKWFLGIVTALALVFGVSATTTANASSWHKGTPSSLRGTYFYKYHDGVRGTDIYKITKSSVYYTPTGAPTSKTTGIKYEKVGKYYRIKGTTHAYGRKFGYDEVFYKKGHSMKALGYSQYKHGGFSKDHYIFYKQ